MNLSLARRDRLLLLPIAALGAMLVLAATPYGLDVGYDSVFYLNGAQNIADGAGYSRTVGNGSRLPITHYPPLYSLTLAPAFSQYVESQMATRLLAAAIIGANLYLIGFILVRYGGVFWSALAAQSIALVSPILLSRHLEAMSEPLYFLLMLVSLMVLTEELLEHKARYVLTAGLLAGLAYLARYVGVSLMLTGVLAVLLFSQRPEKRRILDAAAFIVAASVPTLLWLGRNAALTGSLSNRSLGFHPPDSIDILEAARNASNWLLGPAVPLRLGVLFVFLFVAILIFLMIRNLRPDRDPANSTAQPFIKLLVLHAIVYGLLLLGSITFIDASTRLNDRILSPLFVTLLLLTALLVAQDGWLRARRWRIASLVILWGLLFASYAARSLPILQIARAEGQGFNSVGWRESPTILALEPLPSGTLIYSNEPLPILYVNDQPAYNVPERTDPVLGSERSGYDEALARMRINLLTKNGLLVIFHPADLRPETGALEDLTLGLILLQSYEDGAIYTAP